MACLGAMLNKSVMWELIPKNPATPVKDFKEPAGRNSFLWREIRNGQIYLGGERTENGKPREIPISDRLTNELQRIKAAQGVERITMLTNQVFMASRERKRRFNGILQVVDGPIREIRVASEIQPAEG